MKYSYITKIEGKKILYWQLFRDIETVYKYNPKMNERVYKK